MYGYCPFSEKDDKFYVNVKNGLWDSKTAGLSGNVSKFLALRSKDYQRDLRGSKLRALAENRQLEIQAFTEWQVGWDSAHHSYTFPVRDFDGNVTDIRRYSMRTKLMMSTTGCHVGLIGAHRLKDNPSLPVYLCEGEWDTIALHWLLHIRSVNEPGVVVGVPGAGTFKDLWARWLQGRTVYTLYDNDPAGKQGEELALERLKSSARRVMFVHWPDEVPVGFDTRDWIVYGATIRHTPEICWERLKRRFHDSPKSDEDTRTERVIKDGKITIRRKRLKKIHRWRKPPTIGDVHTVFNKWLFLKTTDVIDVMLAVVLTQRIDGSPVWMFLVGPPGSAKTAIVSALGDVSVTHATSTLTAPSLISGASLQGASDPSLIPKLDKKVLVVKDFTSILSLPDREQKEIFGILRDAYDGRCGKSFGNGIERSYTSRFGILGAVTPRIYDLADQHAALGERFLKFLVGDNLHHESENQIIQRAIENSDRESVMRDELCDVVHAFVERTCANVPIPELPARIMNKIVALAKFGARMRGSVSRDFYHRDIMMSRPMAEVGTRLGQQLAKLAKGMAMVFGKTIVGDIEYSLVKKVMLDTISQRNEDVLRAMISAMGGTTVLTPLSMRELSSKTHYPFATIQRLMQDLAALQIIKKQGAGLGTTWTLSDYVRKEVLESELYTTDELERTSARRIRLIARRVKPHPRTIRAPLGKASISMTGSKITISIPPDNGSAAAPRPPAPKPPTPVGETPRKGKEGP